MQSYARYLGGSCFAVTLLFMQTINAQTVTSSLTIKNTTSGPNAAPINTNGPGSGCGTTIGNGMAMCPNPTPGPVIQPNGTPVVYTATFQQTANNYLMSAHIEYYLDVQDAAINLQSNTSCEWIVQMDKQNNGLWQPTIKRSAVDDTNTPLVPNCSYTNFTYSSTTGQFFITVTFGGS